MHVQDAAGHGIGGFDGGEVFVAEMDAGPGAEFHLFARACERVYVGCLCIFEKEADSCRGVCREEKVLTR